MWAQGHLGSVGPGGDTFFDDAAFCNGMKKIYYYNPGGDIYSRKVFVGELNRVFGCFGRVVVDWPHKNHPPVPGAYVAPKGYVFLVYETEASVRDLVRQCYSEGDKHYLCVTSPMMRNKPVQVRPWQLADAEFVLETDLELFPRRTVFLGGVPRPLKAIDLAQRMNNLFGNVCYAGIDTDPELKYPKGAGRVSFATNESFIAAINAKYVNIKHGDGDKRVEVKPYVLDEQPCDECGGTNCDGKFAQYFCADVSCLQYYCSPCWQALHSKPMRKDHTPFFKERSGRGGFQQRFFFPPQLNSATAAANALLMMESGRGGQWGGGVLGPNHHRQFY